MIKKISKTIKNQKPIRVETQLVYRCPNKKCGLDHWVSFNAAKVKNYKVVCDCGCIFQPKVVKKIKIAYQNYKKRSKSLSQEKPDLIIDNSTYDTYKPGYDIDTEIQNQPKIEIPEEILQKAIPVLIGYGFTKSESSEILQKAYTINQTDNVVELIRLALSNLEK